LGSIQDEVDLLRRIPIFAQIDPNKLKLLALASERLTYGDSQIVMQQGDAGDAAFVVIGGKAEVIIETPSGPTTVAHVKRNDIVGEIAILCDVPRTATIRAEGELEVLKITKDRFVRMLTDFPSLGLGVMRVLADRLARTTTELSGVQRELEQLRSAAD
jgi:CRP/FNR family cyclic AMP-dependent transcriptional regulator